jgi:hypothetical protein
MRYHYPIMKRSNRWAKPFGGPPKKLLDYDERPEAPVRGPLFPRPVFVGLLAVFCVSLMLTVDWFGLLLLNRDGVSDRIGPLNIIRVMAVLMTGIAVPSALLMLHYNRLYSYVSEHNVFFAITFSVSFMLGLPCALVAMFG